MRSDRRLFVFRCMAASSLLGLVHTEAIADVDEADPPAVALGYREDSAKVDTAKYPTHTASQRCSNCRHFEGKATDRSGGCPLFGGKLVAAKGWCSGWVIKA
jgi:High potential iron-sulfur protein|nr:high-potential iron-sulfur protein [Variovorax sp. dw_308]